LAIGGNVKRVLRVLWIPLAIEFANIVAHHVLRSRSEGITSIDIISTAISGIVLFAAGWAVARKLNRITLAILGGLVIWACSTLLVLFMGTEFVAIAPETRMNEDVRMGFILASLLSVPIVAAVSALGAFVGRRSLPSA
jgi:hypothetical protein